MAAIKLVGVAFPIAVVIMLLGVLRLAIGTALDIYPFRLDGAAVAQALGGAWLAVVIVLLVARAMSSAHPERTRRLLVERRLTPDGSRVLWLLLPSLLGASDLVERHLIGRLTQAGVLSTLFITVLFTLVVFGLLRWQGRRAPVD